MPWIEMDLSQDDAVAQAFRRAAPQGVIHAAAMTDVDGCEGKVDQAMAVNRDGTARVARECAEHGARMVYVSTEYIFDGQDGPYTETDAPCPISVYGKSKYLGELAAAKALNDLVVARTTVLFGVHESQNFVTWLLAELKAGRPVSIVDDQVGSPTFADNLASMLLALLFSDRRGIYNTAGADILDRCTFARLAARIFGLDVALVRPITTAQLRAAAPRPLQAGLIMDKFKSHFPDVPVLSMKEALGLLCRQLGGD
jgi:dTDP-4-dehydrorhamnose reductase